jgi:hypothetical protein
MESSPRHVGIEHQAPLVESGNVLNLLEVQLDLHLLILSNSRWVVHLARGPQPAPANPGCAQGAQASQHPCHPAEPAALAAQIYSSGCY